MGRGIPGPDFLGVVVAAVGLVEVEVTWPLHTGVSVFSAMSPIAEEAAAGKSEDEAFLEACNVTNVGVKRKYYCCSSKW